MLKSALFAAAVGAVCLPATLLGQEVSPDAAPAPKPKALKPGWFLIPGTDTSVKINGSIKLDMVCELYGGSRGGFKEDGIFQSAPSIALKGAKTSVPQLGLDADGSSFGFTTETPTNIGKIETVLGFRGGGKGVSVSRAYAKIDEWILLGLNGSLFGSNAGPDSLIGGTGNTGGGTVPQIRLITPMDSGKFSVSLEDRPKAKGLLGPQWNTFSSVGRIDYNPGYGSFSFRGMARKYKGGDSGSIGYGGAIGANFDVLDKDKLAIDVSGGVGMGSFIGGTMGANPQDVVQYGKYIAMWKAFGGSVSYTHEWNGSLRSTLFGGGVVIPEDQNIKTIIDDQASKSTPDKKVKPYSDYNKMFYSIGCNTVWEPNKRLSLGAEANYNYRKTFAADNRSNYGKEFHVGMSATFKVF